ncbi:MAG TPA: MGMT family protein [Dehalococcoidia bacterium]|nr:MGMT family protein [Dehalococcoidia bacterium]
MGVMGSLNGLRRIILPQESKEAVFNQIVNCGCAAENHVPSFFGDLPHRLRCYLEGEAVDFSDKLDFSGSTSLQQSVWHVTRTIPYGETRSYGWVSNQLDLPGAARAIGRALSNNPLPIVVPCHRVITSDGSLGGFAFGLEFKEFLLRLEGCSWRRPARLKSG